MRDEDYETDEEIEERLERQRQRREDSWIYRNEQTERMNEVGLKWRDIV